MVEAESLLKKVDKYKMVNEETINFDNDVEVKMPKASMMSIHRSISEEEINEANDSHQEFLSIVDKPNYEVV